MKAGVGWGLEVTLWLVEGELIDNAITDQKKIEFFIFKKFLKLKFILNETDSILQLIGKRILEY